MAQRHPPMPYGINTASTANTRSDLLRCHPSFRTPPYHSPASASSAPQCLRCGRLRQKRCCSFLVSPPLSALVAALHQYLSEATSLQEQHEKTPGGE
mmetsp:Transcript_38707/g.69779  ORF Transcript_38707/g.69779 Transcript_38707/m.69779 type:complete len:97 (+) Transcript_38707:10-300(+)